MHPTAIHFIFKDYTNEKKLHKKISRNIKKDAKKKIQKM
jgi:hypothetical protein